MILESIHVQNFLSHSDSQVEFTSTPLWLIFGQNGSGKSALFDGLEYALYGHHRAGKRQKMDYLVKHGENQSRVEVIIQLQGVRYRVTHIIDRKGANSAWIDYWDEQIGDWASKNIGKNSSASVWDWLGQRLPLHDLFRSAIYLRQSDTAHFFSGEVKDRLGRFAALIDLSQYTLFSERATKHQKQCEKKRDLATGQLDELGDVSEQIEQNLNNQIIHVEKDLNQVQTTMDGAIDVREGAAEWNRLLSERQIKEDEQQELRDLIQDRDEIEIADRQVRAWDAAAVRLSNYWNQRLHADKKDKEAEQSNRKSQELADKLEQTRAELKTMEKEQQVLNSESIPAMECEKNHWEHQKELLKLEGQIATARISLDTAKREVEHLVGKDEELRRWENRNKALPYLDRLAESRQEVENAQSRIEATRKALSEALKREQTTRDLKDEAEIDQLEKKASLDAAIGRLNRLDEEIAHLKGRIEAHSHIKGKELVCPVCDQELTEDAHQHVRQVLSDEQAKLDELRQQRTEAKQVMADKKEAHDYAQKRFEETDIDHNSVIQMIRTAESYLTVVTKMAQEAETRQAESQQLVEQEYPVYADCIDVITFQWLVAERENVKSELLRVEKEARALTEAMQAQDKLQTTLETLGTQRTTESEPVGDTLSTVEIQTKQRETIEAFEAKAKALDELKSQSDRANKRLNRLTGEVRSLEEKIAAQNDLAENANREADHLRVEANAIKEELAQEWDDLLSNYEHYEAHLHTIDTLRITAERMRNLQQASGQIKQVAKNLQEIKKNLDKILPKYQISLQEAQQRETDARERLQSVRDRKNRLDDELDDLHQRQKRADEVRKIIQEANTEAADWHELADLLKPGGRIQVWITNQEQQQIVMAVNIVLQQLGDSLRVLLGEPLRRTETEIQDVVVVDTTDPAVDPQDPTRNARHFSLLSGGEQFRVALALALALHKRVAGGAAGTIIVDEGFGDLDGDWRDELARQMTDTVGGILNLKLAHSILLCSHSSEVQERFPDRWVVTKQDGKASVRLIHHDSSIENNEDI
jgi:exonuclease SbcC